MYESLAEVVGRYALPAGGLISLIPILFANWCIRSSLLSRKPGLAVQFLAAAASALTSPFPVRWAWVPVVVAGAIQFFMLRRADVAKDFMSRAELFVSIALLFLASALAISYFLLGLLSNAHDQRQAGADMIVSALAFVSAWRRWTIISPR